MDESKLVRSEFSPVEVAAALRDSLGLEYEKELVANDIDGSVFASSVSDLFSSD